MGGQVIQEGLSKYRLQSDHLGALFQVHLTPSRTLTGTGGHKESHAVTQAPHTLTQHPPKSGTHRCPHTKMLICTHGHLDTPATPEHIGSGTHLGGRPAGTHGHTITRRGHTVQTCCYCQTLRSAQTQRHSVGSSRQSCCGPPDTHTGALIHPHDHETHTSPRTHAHTQQHTEMLSETHTLGVWKRFWLSHLEGGMPTGTWWVEAREAAQHPTGHRMPQHRG